MGTRGREGEREGEGECPCSLDQLSGVTQAATQLYIAVQLKHTRQQQLGEGSLESQLCNYDTQDAEGIVHVQ